jgi:hypothetical protein
MNVNEARMVIVEEFAEILLDLTDEDAGTAEEREALRVAMLDAADIIAEALDLEVVDITDGIATVRLNIAGPDGGDEE